MRAPPEPVTAREPALSGEMEIAAIDVGERAGRDLGDLGALMAHIAAESLLHPITVSPAGRLILGPRRLEACKRLGFSRIPAEQASTIQEALDAINRDNDGICQHPQSIAETVDMDLAIRELQRWPRHTGPRDGRHDDHREMIARAYGWNGRQYSIARELVLATRGYRDYRGTRQSLPADARERAVAALAGVRTPSDLSAARRLYRETPRQEPQRHGPRRLPSRRQEESIASALGTLNGITAALAHTTPADLVVPAETIQQWDSDLSHTIRVLTKFRKELRQTDGNRDDD